MKTTFENGVVLETVAVITFRDTVYRPTKVEVELIRCLCRKGERVMAIKWLRGHINCDLLTAKNIIDAVAEVQHRPGDPLNGSVF